MSESDAPADQGAEKAEGYALPDNAVPVLPVRDFVLFPGMVLPLTVGRPGSVAALQEAMRGHRPVAIVMQRESGVENPAFGDLHPVGTMATVLRYVTGQRGEHSIVVQGTERVRLGEPVAGAPFLAARIERLVTPAASGAELDARFHRLREQAMEAVRLLPNAPQELGGAIESVSEPALLADMVAGLLDLTAEEKQQILEILDLRERLDRVLWHLAYRLEVLRLSHDIGERTRSSMEGRQREFLLREQLKSIQKELGEEGEESAEAAELAKKIDAAGMPDEVADQARRELKRLERMPEGAAEHGMVRTYLDWLVELPWRIEPEPPIDLKAARQVLDEDHFGLDKIKRRILEFLAVRKLKPDGRSPILCFVGPPGVGKTSLGQSIAKATGRKFVRVSLGGVHDEAEIRGHRRTYVGALPGNIIQGIRRAGARNCVMMLDEIDKLGASHQGDPSSAMLEVLDPEQNGTFRDNYLAVPFDLSRVLFIATANVLESIPGPLRDRMEIVRLSGYTAEEKLAIAKRYLVRRQQEANGLEEGQSDIEDAALSSIIQDYTREAGVRNLEREIGSVLRNAAVRIAEGEASSVHVTPDDLPPVLGPHRFENEIAQRTSVPGVATGLAWTPVGGDILFIEATRTPGGGKLILTGQLGEVMRESVQAALSLVKGKAASLGIDPAAFDKSDIHVHVPAGATPKDGPSAGVAMFTALTSLLTGRTVRSDTAMTGEVSLRGLVLPVGGIREKVVAAMGAGIRTVILPARNKRDLEDIPESARNALRFVWAERVEDAIAVALEGPADAEADGAAVSARGIDPGTAVAAAAR